MSNDDYTPLYRAVSEVTKDLILSLNRQHSCSFLIPTRFISSENAQLAYLMNEYYNQNRTGGKRTTYRSFFSSSRYEALQGAFKLMRHNGIRSRKKKIIILDSVHEIQFIVNPLHEEDESEYLLPGIKIVDDITEFKDTIDKNKELVGAVILNMGDRYSIIDYDEIIRKCKNKSILTAWFDPDHIPGDIFVPHKMTVLPDVIILGEALTGNEVPFGIFSMTRQAHKVWSGIEDCMMHTSTYAGNKLAVIKARDTMMNHFNSISDSIRVKENCLSLESNIKMTLRFYKKYINPGMVKLYSLLGYDFICEEGHGAWIRIQDKRGRRSELIDAVSGGGTAVRGHTPEDIEEVIQQHDINTDYWEGLEQRLGQLFSLPNAFPAVSGATAVEIAFILLLLSSEDKKRIIVFRDNYAGNTLVSMIGTGDEDLHSIFSPIYKNVTYLDVFHAEAVQNLTTELEKGGVAFIWMELVQGATLQAVPPEILEIVLKGKEKYGYFVGVDEILMGFYRMGGISSHVDKKIRPDVVTLSKIMTDGTFPMAATLVSDTVYKRALKRNHQLVHLLGALYKNQLGAHIAKHCIDVLTDAPQEEKTTSVGRILEEGINQICEQSPYLSEVLGRGHIYCLYYKKDLANFYFCKKAIKQGLVFLYIDRLILANTLSKEEACELIARLGKLYVDKENSLFRRFKVSIVILGIRLKLFLG